MHVNVKVKEWLEEDVIRAVVDKVEKDRDCDVAYVGICCSDMNRNNINVSTLHVFTFTSLTETCYAAPRRQETLYVVGQVVHVYPVSDILTNLDLYRDYIVPFILDTTATGPMKQIRELLTPVIGHFNCFTGEYTLLIDQSNIVEFRKLQDEFNSIIFRPLDEFLGHGLFSTTFK